MKLSVNNLGILQNNVNPLSPVSGNNNPTENWNMLPKDKRFNLVPKNYEPMFKEGDKMRIPGVLDYTGAKYPFKKKRLKKKQVEKGQEGLIVPEQQEFIEFSDPETGAVYYMNPNEPFDENGQRISYTDTQGSNPAPTSIQLQEVIVPGNKLISKAKNKLRRLNLSTDVLRFGRAVELINKLPDENVKAAFTKGKRMIENPKIDEDLEPEMLDMVDLFYKTDVVNRIKDSYQNISEEDLQLIGNIIDLIPIRYGNYSDKNFVTGRWGGYHHNGIDNEYIAINPFYTNDITSMLSTIAHELTHGYRQGKGNYIFDSGKPGYNETETSLLNDAYDGMVGFKYAGKYPIKDENEYHSIIEKGTSNVEMRFRLFKDFYTKYKKEPTTDELNRYIDNMDSRELIKMFKNLNGYTNYMYNNILKQRDPDEVARKIKEAMKLVAYNDTPRRTLVAKSGIKIKKKNRGKFTEYCGGNVTQDCINRAKHSGNKKLVKRAVFAENSRKWGK